MENFVLSKNTATQMFSGTGAFREGFMLTKESTNESIKDYFEYVHELNNNGEEYPISLDDVWMLVYSRKDSAVRELRKSYIENEDFTSFRKKAEREIGGSESVSYHLSVPCFEYFIAKKVRAVFEVYRKVFHKTINALQSPQPMTQMEIVAMCANQLVEQERQMRALQANVDNNTARLDAIEQERTQATKQLLASELSDETVPEFTLQNKILSLVGDYARATGIAFSDVWHNIYKGLRYSYGISINQHKKIGKESTFKMAMRLGYGDKIFAIVSDMVKRLKVA